VLVSAVLFGIRPLVTRSGPTFASIYMGATRFNTFVGIAGADALYGSAGLTLSALVIAVMVPLVNFLSVLVLVATVPGSGATRPTLRSTAVQVVSNPLILACALGIGLNVSAITPPAAASIFVHTLGTAALPLGLLAVGAGLETGALSVNGRALAWSIAFKLVAMPLAVAATCALFDVGGLTARVAILFAALPSATTAYVIARQMGGDAPLMAGIITLSTVAAALTMPVFLVLFG